MDGMLSQEEINALLGGMGDSAENTSDVVANEPTPAWEYEYRFFLCPDK